MANRETGRHLVDRLLAFVQNPDEDIRSMSEEEINSYLLEHGVGLDDGHQELMQQIGKIKGRWRLADARQKREGFQERMSQLIAKGEDGLANVRQEVARRLRAMDQREPGLAQVYFRKFENATDQDLEAMLQDLRLLDELDEGCQ